MQTQGDEDSLFLKSSMTMYYGNFGSAKERGCLSVQMYRAKKGDHREMKENISAQICFPVLSIDLRIVLIKLILGANKAMPL